ncbi:hypothetical protein Tco_1326898 [Tanacetum coccineum]
MYYPRFTKVIIHYFLTKDKTVSWRNKIVMHTSRDDFLINTLKFVSANEVSQIYGARLPESITSPEMRETKAYPNSLISLSRGSFDVIVGMDWLSKRKFVIVCHEKVARIPLEGDEILRVHGEHTQGVVKTLMNTKVEEPKLSDISIVRDFIYVFLEDLLGLPPQRQVKFHIELQDKGFISFDTLGNARIIWATSRVARQGFHTT